MRHSIRLSIGAAAIAALAACSGTSEQPTLSDELKQDLARAGGSEVQLAGAAGSRVDVVSAAERTDGAVAAPRSPTVSRAPSATRGNRAPVRSVRRETPAAAAPEPRAEEPAPAEVRRETPAPEPGPAAGRPQAPRPSTQREPPGGWRTPGEIIRNAPFPINP
jgi:phage protein D